MDHGKRETSADVGLSRRGPLFQPLCGEMCIMERGGETM